MRVPNPRPRPRPGLFPAILLVLLTATLVASARPAAAATAVPRPPKVVATGPSHLARRPSAALATATTLFAGVVTLAVLVTGFFKGRSWLKRV